MVEASLVVMLFTLYCFDILSERAFFQNFVNVWSKIQFHPIVIFTFKLLQWDEIFEYVNLSSMTVWIDSHIDGRHKVSRRYGCTDV